MHNEVNKNAKSKKKINIIAYSATYSIKFPNLLEDGTLFFFKTENLELQNPLL